MKMHNYVSLVIERSLIGKYWRYNVTACGFRRQEDDFHIDGAKTPEEVTCKKCMAKLEQFKTVLLSTAK